MKFSLSHDITATPPQTWSDFHGSAISTERRVQNLCQVHNSKNSSHKTSAFHYDCPFKPSVQLWTHTLTTILVLSICVFIVVLTTVSVLYAHWSLCIILWMMHVYIHVQKSHAHTLNITWQMQALWALRHSRLICYNKNMCDINNVTLITSHVLIIMKGFLMMYGWIYSTLISETTEFEAMTSVTSVVATSLHVRLHWFLCQSLLCGQLSWSDRCYCAYYYSQ